MWGTSSFNKGSYNKAQEDWAAYKARLEQASAQQGTSPQAKTPGSPAIQPTTQNMGIPGGPSALSGVGAASVPPTGAANPGGPIDTSAFVPSQPGDYYYGWDPGSNIANDPEQANRAWSQHMGYGEGVNDILNRFDPMAVLQMMGNPLSALASPKDKLDAIGGFNNLLLGQKGSAGGFFDPRAMVANVAALANSWKPGGTETSTGTSGVNTGSYIDNPTLDPRTQVKNTVEFILAGLQGVVPAESYQAYANLLQREGMKFIDWREKNPDTMQTPGGNGSFLDWVVRVFGPGLGLF